MPWGRRGGDTISWYKIVKIKVWFLSISDEWLGSLPVHLLSDLPGDGVVEVLVDAGAGVTAHQGEPPEGPAVHDPDGQGRAVHLLLGQLHVQVPNILAEIGVFVGVLDHGALQQTKIRLHKW